MKTKTITISTLAVVVASMALWIWGGEIGKPAASDWEKATMAATRRASASAGKLDSNRIEREEVAADLKHYRAMALSYASDLRLAKSNSQVAIATENLRDANERVRSLEEKERCLVDEQANLEGNR